MYRCNDCNKLFEEPKQVTELMGEYWGHPAYQEFCYCPECDSEDIEEITENSIEAYSDEDLIDKYQYFVEMLGDTSIIPDVIKQEDEDYQNMQEVISEMDRRNLFEKMEEEHD